MATTSWRGAIEFAGFPVNVTLYGQVKSRGGDSFKTLDPKHKLPVAQQYVDVKGKAVPRDTTLKGVDNNGSWVALTAEQVESIGDGERSQFLTPASFSPMSTIDLSLALTTYAVLPDAKVAGSDASVNTIWNGLLDTGMAYVSTLTMRSGSRDAIVVFYATDEALYAATLPFVQELQDLPRFDFERNDKQAQMFRSFIDDDLIKPFAHDEFVSEYRVRRQQAIEAALKGKKAAPTKAEPKKQEPATDLMAALEAQVAKKAGGKKKVAA